jgi:hypothetical protein
MNRQNFWCGCANEKRGTCAAQGDPQSRAEGWLSRCAINRQMTAALIARRAAEAAPLFRSNRSLDDGARRIGRYLVTHSLLLFLF